MMHTGSYKKIGLVLGILMLVAPMVQSNEADVFRQRLDYYNRELSKAESQQSVGMRFLRGVSGVGLGLGLSGMYVGLFEETGALLAASFLFSLPVGGVFGLSHSRIRTGERTEGFMTRNIRNTEAAIAAREQGAPIVITNASRTPRSRTQDVVISYTFMNVSDQTIKYVRTSTLPYNRVGEVSGASRPQDFLRFREAVGPIETGARMTDRAVADWPPAHAQQIRIEGIQVVFMNDTTWESTDGAWIAEHLAGGTPYQRNVADISYVPEFSTFPRAGGETSEHPYSSAAYGTGFIISTDGYIVTNHHVIQGARAIEIHIEGQVYSAEVVVSDPSVDLAIIKSDAIADLNIAPLRVGDYQATLGAQVFTIGFPNPDLQGRSPKFTDGRISSQHGLADDPRWYQISVPVQPGNSGGPLVTEDGIVNGVIVARLSDIAAFARTGSLPQNVNYAVKSTRLVPLLRDVGLDYVIHQSGSDMERPADVYARTSEAVVQIVSKR